MSDPRLSVNEYPGDGVTTEYEISFAGGYLSQDYVKVRVIAADGLTASDAVFTWVGPYQISLATAPAVGTTLQIARETPFDAPIVDFAEGAIINEETLDTNARQAIQLAAELRDQIGSVPGWSDILVATGNAEQATADLNALIGELELNGMAKVYDRWATLEDVVGTADKVALVIVQDGQHTDPVSGGLVDNSGFFRWSVGPAGWNWFAPTQAAIAVNAANEAEGYAAALSIGTAGGWYDTLAAGAADPAVAEGDGYFYLTAGRFYIGQKVGGVGVNRAEFLTSAATLEAILGASLTALSPLVPAANTLPYYTGGSSASLTTLTAVARDVLAAPTKADLRASVGVVIGTDVQAYDEDLSALSGVANTSFGRGLLALAGAGNLLTAATIVVSGDGASGKITIGSFVLSWRDHTRTGLGSAAFGYGDGHAYTTWARAWLSGDDAAGDMSYVVTSSGLTTATVRSNGSGTGSFTLFAIGV